MMTDMFLRWVRPTGPAVISFLFVGCMAACTMSGCGGSQPGASTQTAPDDPDPQAVEQAAALVNLLPSEAARARAVVTGEPEPTEALFGLELDDGTRVFLIGTLDAGAALSVTSVQWYSADGSYLLEQHIGPSGTQITYATGDFVAIEQTDGGLLIWYGAAATVPPTVIVARVDGAGGVRIDESLSSFGSAENLDYPLPANAKLRGVGPAAWKSSRVGHAGTVPFRPELSGVIARFSGFDLCNEIVDAGLTLGDYACDILSISNALGNAAEFTANAHCIAVLRALELIKSDEASTRLGASLKFGTTLACEGLNQSLRAAALAGKITPLDLACLAMSVTDEGIQLAAGGSSADPICAIIGEITSDPDDDHVFSHEDNCPEHYNPGSPVQPDSDSDGAGNACDECPGTPLDTLVDAVGCPSDLNDDGDNDGVANTVDRCPDTLGGAVVDAEGCAECQRDDDRDTVLNCDDNCPHMVTTNVHDGDGDGVGDECDNCVNHANPNQEDVNFNQVGDRCEGQVIVHFYSNTDGTTGTSAEGAQIQVYVIDANNRGRPAFDWSDDLPVHSILVGGSSSGAAPQWSLTAFVVTPDSDPVPTTFSSSILQYGSYSDPNAIYEESQVPAPDLTVGAQYLVTVGTTSGESAVVIFTIQP